MTSKARLAALQILTLREEFSAKELRDALILAGEWSAVLTSKARRDETLQNVRRGPNSTIAKSESRVVIELRERDPERYSILSKIDRAIRLGQMLPRVADIQRAGSSLDKGFISGKSKGTAIPRLMAKLAELPVAELENLYQTWKQEMRSELRRDTEYDDLAEFLVKGQQRRRQSR